MNKLKHEWHLEHDGVEKFIQNKDSNPIFNIEEYATDEEINIALAAPEMLEALIKLVKITTKSEFVSSIVTPIIEKATGQSIKEVLKDEARND